jgi:hypothetical protein
MTPRFDALHKTLGYEKSYPTVHKVDARYIPHMKGQPSKWNIAYPGGMEPIKWYTADHPNEKLHPQKTPAGTLIAIGKTESGRKFKMEFQKEDGEDILCPFNPETWKPLNMKSGTGKSAGEEI